ncbi:MAG: hypothetical protein OXC60_04265 [Litoreibacter sp.]|nr:hypothetical protein [Litoreibacter sp.]
MRFVALRCRVKPRTELFEACALLDLGQAASRDAHAEALMRCWGEALGQTARFYAPGVRDFTFDERWLMQLGQAHCRGDNDSLRFLLSSRVIHRNRRLVGFLVGGVAECFDLK